jgi:hypothetical protein
VSIAIPEPNFIQIYAASEWLDPASRRAFLIETAASGAIRDKAQKDSCSINSLCQIYEALVGHSARAGSAAMLLADAQAKLDREGGRILLVTCVANQKVKACRYSSCLSIAS